MNKNLIKLIVCMVVLSLLIPATCMGEEIVLKLGTQAQASSDWIGYLDRVNTRLGELSGGTMRIEIALGGQLGSNAEHWAQMNAGQFTQSCIDTVKITDPVRGSLGLRAQFQNDLLAHASHGDQEGKNHHTYDQLD